MKPLLSILVCALLLSGCATLKIPFAEKGDRLPHSRTSSDPARVDAPTRQVNPPKDRILPPTIESAKVSYKETACLDRF